MKYPTNQDVRINDIIRKLRLLNLAQLDEIYEKVSSTISVPAEPMPVKSTMNLCSVCYRPQDETKHGLLCSNGHSGVGSLTLSEDQNVAWDALKKWLSGDHPFFVLKGFAGSGKSFLMKLLLTLPHKFLFSAPTNKASKVLSSYLNQQVKTTYSLLGLRMKAEDDQLVLTQAAELPDLGEDPILVIDEAGMIPKFMSSMLKDAAASKGWRIIFVGDPAQLNPVGERLSPVWKFAHPEHTVLMRKIMRFDNELLALSVAVRECLRDKNYNLKFNAQGAVSYADLDKQLLKVSNWRDTKILAWRNKTVDRYNSAIREHLGFTDRFAVGEFILMGAPLISDGNILAHTDEEFEVASVTKRIFNFAEGPVEAYALSLVGCSFSLYVPVDEARLTKLLNNRAALASGASNKVERKKLWADFWDLKNTFQSVRYGYAMTVHRAQGSQYKTVLVDKSDITANPEKREAYRCLYVACTRATDNIILG